jgi:3-hydroxyacyl-[acyl-carrier-protein] dehydratase
MIGVDTIKRLIPHRHPILLVDRVIEVVPGSHLVAIKAVTVTEPCYAFADSSGDAAGYAYPTSLLLESWAQSAVLLACWDHPNPDVLAGKVELAAGIRKVELPAPVYPGDVVEHRVELVKTIDDAAVVSGGSRVGDTEVLRVGQFTVALRDVAVLYRIQPAPREVS